MNKQIENTHSRPFIFSLLRASSCVRRRHAAVCEAHGLTFQQFNVLRILRGAETGGERGGLPTMEVAARMVEPEPGITRIIGQLEAMGFIHRSKGAQDARCLLCQITDAGQKALAALDLPIKTLVQELLAGLSAQEIDLISSALNRIGSEKPPA